MPYVLRFVQRYRPADEKAFLALEAKFAALERRGPPLPTGRRAPPSSRRGAGPHSRSGIDSIRPRGLARWSRIPASDLVGHPHARLPLRLVKDSAEMGLLMASE